MSMKYKVGDYVRIRKDIKYNEYMNGCRVNEIMETYAGKITRVISVDNCSLYRLKNDCDWFWGEDALEPFKFEDLFSIASEIAGKNITIRNQKCGSTPHV